MMRVALTGSIGMGKSTVAAMFAARGVPLFDADAAVHRVEGVNGSAVAAIGQRFPGTVRDGAVDRAALAGRVLGRPEELRALEAIVHPAVAAERDAFIAAHPDVPLLLFDVPLLFETGGEHAYDKVIVVTAPAPVQRERVLSRPGMTIEKLAAILARQLPDAEKRRRADFLVDTGGSLAETERQVEQILACLPPAAGS